MKTYTPQDLAVKDLHQFIVGAIAPRPIAFVSTVDENGIENLAPYSFFNAFSSNPPIFVFSSNRRVKGNTTKDTLHNITANAEVVINVVNYNMVQQMALASISYPAEVNEFDKSGLTPIASESVKPSRVKESPVQFECRVNEVQTLGEHGGAGHLIICEVLKIHIDENIIDEKGRIDPNKADLVGRLGRAYYVRASGDALFTVVQDQEVIGIGYDQMPKHILDSQTLVGNEIAQLAGIPAIPSKEEVQLLLNNNVEMANIMAIENKEQRHLAAEKYAKVLLKDFNVKDAFSVLMHHLL